MASIDGLQNADDIIYVDLDFTTSPGNCGGSRTCKHRGLPISILQTKSFFENVWADILKEEPVEGADARAILRAIKEFARYLYP